MEANNRQGRDILRAVASLTKQFDRVDDRLSFVKRTVLEPASDPVLLANRVEEGFSRALRVSIRLDEAEDRASP